MIWEPFVLALFLGLIVSAGLYFAYMWPSIEPLDEPLTAAADSAPGAESTDVDDSPEKPADAKAAAEEPAAPSSPS